MFFKKSFLYSIYKVSKKNRIKTYYMLMTKKNSNKIIFRNFLLKSYKHIKIFINCFYYNKISFFYRNVQFHLLKDFSNFFEYSCYCRNNNKF